MTAPDQLPSRETRGEFLEALTNPALLNLVCGMFALERAYDVMGIENLPGGYGHFKAVVLYTAGFLLGLFSLWTRRRVPWLHCLCRCVSYLLLVGASVWLLFVLYKDTGVAKENWRRHNSNPAQIHGL